MSNYFSKDHSFCPFIKGQSNLLVVLIIRDRFFQGIALYDNAANKFLQLQRILGVHVPKSVVKSIVLYRFRVAHNYTLHHLRYRVY